MRSSRPPKARIQLPVVHVTHYSTAYCCLRPRPVARSLLQQPVHNYHYNQWVIAELNRRPLCRPAGASELSCSYGHLRMPSKTDPRSMPSRPLLRASKTLLCSQLAPITHRDLEVKKCHGPLSMEKEGEMSPDITRRYRLLIWTITPPCNIYRLTLMSMLTDVRHVCGTS